MKPHTLSKWKGRRKSQSSINEGKVWKVLERETCLNLWRGKQGQGVSGKGHPPKERWTKVTQVTGNKTTRKHEQDPSKTNGNKKIVPCSIEFTSQRCSISSQ